MQMYKVKYYIDNKDQVDGIKSHNDMYKERGDKFEKNTNTFLKEIFLEVT